jgi:hypothetical protein
VVGGRPAADTIESTRCFAKPSRSGINVDGAASSARATQPTVAAYALFPGAIYGPPSDPIERTSTITHPAQAAPALTLPSGGTLRPFGDIVQRSLEVEGHAILLLASIHCRMPLEYSDRSQGGSMITTRATLTPGVGMIFPGSYSCSGKVAECPVKRGQHHRGPILTFLSLARRSHLPSG